MTPSTFHLPPEKHSKCYGCIEKAVPLTLPRRVELCILPAVSASLQKKKPSSGGRANSTILQGSEVMIRKLFLFPVIGMRPPGYRYCLHHYIMSCDKFRTRLAGCIMCGC
jgi:hypothetical protein